MFVAIKQSTYKTSSIEHSVWVKCQKWRVGGREFFYMLGRYTTSHEEMGIWLVGCLVKNNNLRWIDLPIFLFKRKNVAAIMLSIHLFLMMMMTSQTILYFYYTTYPLPLPTSLKNEIQYLSSSFKLKQSHYSEYA